MSAMHSAPLMRRRLCPSIVMGSRYLVEYVPCAVRVGHRQSAGLGVLPLPVGERVGVRGRGTLRYALAPSPAPSARPLPAGERWSKWRGLASLFDRQRVDRRADRARDRD